MRKESIACPTMQNQNPLPLERAIFILPGVPGAFSEAGLCNGLAYKSRWLLLLLLLFLCPLALSLFEMIIRRPTSECTGPANNYKMDNQISHDDNKHTHDQEVGNIIPFSPLRIARRMIEDPDSLQRRRIHGVQSLLEDQRVDTSST